jgi:hypothetical protein
LPVTVMPVLTTLAPTEMTARWRRRPPRPPHSPRAAQAGQQQDRGQQGGNVGTWRNLVAVGVTPPGRSCRGR